MRSWMRTEDGFLGMYLVPKLSDQMPVPSYGDQLLKERVMQDEDVGSFALWNNGMMTQLAT